jgi:2,4-dienoyl-CoA reductase (NADPH2)
MDLISRIQESEIEVLADRKIERIEPDGVVLSSPEVKEERVKADIVVLALGVVSVNDLSGDLQGKIQEVRMIGDCLRPRKIIDAVYEGFLAGTRI